MPSPDEPAENAREAAPPTEPMITTFDPRRERPTTAVVTGVASLLERDPLELESLSEVVEPDALDAFVAHAQRQGVDGVHELWFCYEGFEVGVQTDGRIVIREQSTESRDGVSRP